jgi:hypothetical protein
MDTAAHPWKIEADPARGILAATEMWAIVSDEPNARPIALFASERSAWYWMFHTFGENHTNTVRPFMVTAAALEGVL